MQTNCILSEMHKALLNLPLPSAHGSLLPAGQSPKVLEQHLGPFRTRPPPPFAPLLLLRPTKLQAAQAVALSLNRLALPCLSVFTRLSSPPETLSPFLPLWPCPPPPPPREAEGIAPSPENPQDSAPSLGWHVSCHIINSSWAPILLTRPGADSSLGLQAPERHLESWCIEYM